MVIIVPAFAVRQEGDPPAVGGGIFGLKGAVAEFVGGAVDEPGGVVHQDEADEYAPQKERPAVAGEAADTEEECREDELDGEEVFVEKLIEAIVGNVFGKTGNLVFDGDIVEHPTHVAPPEAFGRVVVIGVLVRKDVVMAV